MRVLCLPTDGFGGHGGIAQHCRHLLNALAGDPHVGQLVAIPRLLPVEKASIPPEIEYITDRSPSNAGYLSVLLRHGFFSPRWRVVVAEHINLLPLAALIAKIHRARLCLVVYGFEAWSPPDRYPQGITRQFLDRLDVVIAVSRITGERFARWSAMDPSQIRVVPAALEPGVFSPGPRSTALAQRYGIKDGPVIMTMGRLSSAERSKGFEEVIRVLPSLTNTLPGLRYLVVGGGDDLPRLQQLVQDLELSETVVFTGHIDEAEKAEHYRLADAYVMPSRLEGFGYVFLEAMATGLPVVGSRLDGSSEPLMDGRLGALVDPDEPDEIRRAIVRALKQEKSVPEELEFFSLERFDQQTRDAVLYQA